MNEIPFIPGTIIFSPALSFTIHSFLVYLHKSNVSGTVWEGQDEGEAHRFLRMDRFLTGCQPFFSSVQRHSSLRLAYSVILATLELQHFQYLFANKAWSAGLT